MVTDVRILRRPEVCKLTGFSKTTIDDLERRGEFPSRRRMSSRACGWLSSEIEAWIRDRPLASIVRADLAGDPHRDERKLAKKKTKAVKRKRAS